MQSRHKILVAIVVFFIGLLAVYGILGDDSECASYSEENKGMCYSGLSMDAARDNPEYAWDLCSRILDSELMNTCYNDVGVIVAEANTTSADAVCARIPDSRWRGECFFNVALEAARKKQSGSIYLCDKAGMYKVFCYHDVAGEISLFSHESILDVCGNLSDELTRRACYHGVGKYLGRVNGSLARQVCSRKDISRYDECFHGLGWGVSESMNYSVSLEVCGSLDTPVREDCIVGCAWEVSRSDRELAAFICDKVLNSSLKSKCINFPG